MPKRSRTSDVNQNAARIVAEATKVRVAVKKNPAAVALGRLGGQKGGPARAASLSASKRAEIARKAAQSRWEKKKAK